MSNRYWPEDGCLICGRARNKWCDEYHLPVAEAEAESMAMNIRAYRAQLTAYRAATMGEQ